MRLRRAVLFVKDLDRMAAFYQAALGLLPVPGGSSPGWLELDAGGTSLGLHAVPPEVAASLVIADPPVPREETPIKLVFEVPDLEVACQRLRAAGAVVGAPTPWRSCDALDPEGNVFQVAEGA
jgi:catechol 2,3-dioxygenase-like lactoylglutathione lyase family enzyme